MVKKQITRRHFGVAGSAVVLAAGVPAPFLRAATDSNSGSEVKLWLETSLQRVFPNSPAGNRSELSLLGARNQKLSFQACIRNESTKRLRVECSASSPQDVRVRIRRVGYVPMPHRTTDVPMDEQDGVESIPGMVPDPLFQDQHADVGPWENQPFWISFEISPYAQPGPKTVKIAISTERDKTKEKVVLGELTAKVDVRAMTIKPRQGFPVTHWWQPDAIYDWYKTEPFSEKWWQLAGPYLSNMVSHGSNVIMVPVWHTRREVVTRPPQLLKVTEPSPGRYEFDFSEVRRFVELAKGCGMEYFEFPHFWLYWGVRNPVHVYRRQGDHFELLWPTESDATAGVFRSFLEQYIPALHNFLKQEHLVDRSYFHVSDEPGGDEQFRNYKKARALLKELAPWMKVMDALSDIGYGKEGVTDIPVPILPAAQKYIEAGIPHWVYFCTGPRGRYLNRLFDTPLPKIRMAGWLFYRLGAKGFLHWGYGYWYKMETQQLLNVFEEGAGGDWPSIPYGDPFVVYPGPDGPLDSIRWEVFAESLQDYAILQTAGVRPDSALLSEIKGYDNFPKNEAWINQALAKILA